jgi:VanZ family protein
LLYWLPVLVWAALIFWLSSLSVTPEPESVRQLPGWSQEAHFALYLVLGALLLRAIARPVSTRRLLLPMVIGALYAASDELHQYFVPGRQADMFDFIIDVAGLAFGILLVQYFFSKWMGRNKS